ncbi:hypothetical protein NFI96_014962 [Prochilodus magdalenae]|nr:hypothetical protein NFI96_014962 [Prochilodus magdalenae]
MSQLLRMGMFKRISLYDYQAMCKVNPHSTSSARPLLSPFYNMMAALKWFLSNVLLFLLDFNIYGLWHSDHFVEGEYGDGRTPSKKSKGDVLQPCDTEYPSFVYEPSIKETNSVIKCGRCQNTAGTLTWWWCVSVGGAGVSGSDTAVLLGTSVSLLDGESSTNQNYPVGSVLRTASCGRCPVGSVLWVVSHGQRPEGSILGAVSCGQRPKGSILWAVSCGQRHVGDVPGVVFRGWCPVSRMPCALAGGTAPWAASCGQRPVGQRPVGQRPVPTDEGLEDDQHCTVQQQMSYQPQHHCMGLGFSGWVFVIQQIPESNLLLMVVQADCDCSRQYSPITMEPREVVLRGAAVCRWCCTNRRTHGGHHCSLEVAGSCRSPAAFMFLVCGVFYPLPPAVCYDDGNVELGTGVVLNCSPHNASVKCDRMKSQKIRRRPESCHAYHPQVNRTVHVVPSRGVTGCSMEFSVLSSTEQLVICQLSVHVEEYSVFRSTCVRSDPDVGREGLALSLRSNPSQRCSIGWRSGLCAGQSSSSTPDSLLHVFMELALCTGVRSCWNRKGPSPNCPTKLGAWNGPESLGLLKH